MTKKSESVTPFDRFNEALKDILSVKKKDLDLKSAPKKPVKAKSGKP